MNQDTSTEPLARPIARSALVPHCSLRSRASLCSFVCSLTFSLAPEHAGRRNIFVRFSRRSESLCLVFVWHLFGVNFNQQSTLCHDDIMMNFIQYYVMLTYPEYVFVMRN